MRPVTNKYDVAHVGGIRSEYNSGQYRHRSVVQSNSHSNNVDDLTGGIDP